MVRLPEGLHPACVQLRSSVVSDWAGHLALVNSFRACVHVARGGPPQPFHHRQLYWAEEVRDELIQCAGLLNRHSSLATAKADEI